ncbi:hypothetical protein GCM10011297_23590 [Bacterioplanes sanyensis]|uniref:hypothetical protein n=1 Tax=Bacterioplanes sanyensis TaxID=1249553 RepID=UPI00167A1F02|nr:hypothetical protein [Bacterioplanes sanyensis]GGY49850.1 hypothetical protein GCM10011297_23590 [Bacterioplanes sanyensis]
MNKHALLLAMLTATLGLTACGGGGSSSSGDDTPETPDTGTGGDSNGGTDGNNDGDTPPANNALTMTFELGDSYYLAVLDSNGEWQQKTGESEVVVDVASSSDPVTYLYLCKDGGSANYSYMRTLYLAQPSKTRLCQYDSSAEDAGNVAVQSQGADVIDIIMNDITTASSDGDFITDIDLIGRDVPRTYLAVGKNGDDYFIQRREGLQLQGGDTLTIDFTSDDTVKVSPATATADAMEYGLVYRTLDSVSRLTLTLDDNRYIPIPAALMRDGDWFDEYYRFSDETRFKRATQAPQSEGFIQASLPPVTLSNVSYSQDKLTASAPLLGDAPESLPHGFVSLSYRLETDSYEYFGFNQHIMLPQGHTGVATIPAVDLTALPGFPQWGMFDYNGDHLAGWQYGYSAALAGSLEQDAASLYRRSQPD